MEAFLILFTVSFLISLFLLFDTKNIIVLIFPFLHVVIIICYLCGYSPQIDNELEKQKTTQKGFNR